MAEDMSAAVQEYLGRCEVLASSLARRGTRGINGVEFDDLVQEGLIAAWQSMARGVSPSEGHLRARMIDYMRWLGNRGPVPYYTAMPIDGFISREALNESLYVTPKEESDGTDPITFLGEVQGD